jgi:hypothetical protein
MTARRTLTYAGAVAALALLAAACTGTPASPVSGSAAAVAPAASPSTAAPGPSPRATELNPPGDIPDNAAYVAYTPAGGGYAVKVPEGWARTSSGTTTSFTDKLNRIEVSSATAPAEPTVASVTSTEIAALTASVPGFAKGTVSSTVRKGGTVILLTYQGDSAPDQVTGKVVRDAFERYTFYRAGTRIDLTLSGPTNADNVDPWRIVSDSLRWS